MIDNSESKLGVTSFRLSILGVLVPVVVAFLSNIFVEGDLKPYYILCFLLFAGFEFIALISGVIGRSSPAGKAGLGISSVFIALGILAVWTILFAPSEPPKDSPQAVPSNYSLKKVPTNNAEHLQNK